MTTKKTVAVTEEKSKGGFKERRKECLTSANKIPTVNIKVKNILQLMKDIDIFYNTFQKLDLMKKYYSMIMTELSLKPNYIFLILFMLLVMQKNIEMLTL